MATEPATSPRAHYEARIRACADAERRQRRVHDVFAWARVAMLVLLVGALYQACDSRQFSTVNVGVPFTAFVALSFVIGGALRRIARASEARAFYEGGIARLESRWDQHAPRGEAFQDAEHPFAADLDLFGPQSLFALICTARTPGGQQTLGGWLLRPAGAAEVKARQAAVAELSGMTELREELWLAGGALKREVKSEKLAAWVRAPTSPARTSVRLFAAALAVVGVGAAAALLLGYPLLGLGLALPPVAFAHTQRGRVMAVSEGTHRRADELKAVAAIARIVEGQRFQSERLVSLQQALRSDGGVPAHARIAQLVHRVDWFESRRNAFFALFAAPVLLGTQLALAIEAWRARHGEDVARWIEALAELEALSSLATFSHEHPEMPFPEIVPDEEGPRFEARALGHPLLPAGARVTNDVSLTPALRLLLVTGSNMSGKSTLLRTVGANAVLALAGAPVCAQELRLTRLSIGATLRTFDSLQAGVSRFFAEIKRLRQIVSMADESPLTLFLLDEILHGTNSQDRFAGASALVRVLVERRAIGLVTTHDLALARIVDELGPGAANVHFQDVIDDGQLRFDYQLRPGIVSRSNAIALMRLVGLPV